MTVTVVGQIGAPAAAAAACVSQLGGRPHLTGPVAARFRLGVAGYCADMGFQVTQVQKCLSGFDYPGTPEELAEHARRNGAEPQLVDTLRALKRDSFDGPEAVMGSLGAQNALGG